MAFLEIRFPTNVSLGAVGGQGWSTRVVTTDAGFEYRQQLWDRTRGHWHVGHNLRSPTEWAALVAFHRLAQGKTNGFRFQDWSDYTDGGNGVVVANPNGTLQLAKTYTATNVVTLATITNTRLISKPQPGTITFFGGSPTLDYTTGALTAGGSTGVTWTGQFDIPARFDIDDPEISMDLPLTGAGWRGIPIIEIRVKDP
jgi:uncharacterized protein (TIGR02217 family)